MNSRRKIQRIKRNSEDETEDNQLEIKDNQDEIEQQINLDMSDVENQYSNRLGNRKKDRVRKVERKPMLSNQQQHDLSNYNPDFIQQDRLNNKRLMWNLIDILIQISMSILLVSVGFNYKMHIIKFREYIFATIDAIQSQIYENNSLHNYQDGEIKLPKDGENNSGGFDQFKLTINIMYYAIYVIIISEILYLIMNFTIYRINQLVRIHDMRIKSFKQSLKSVRLKITEYQMFANSEQQTITYEEYQDLENEYHQRKQTLEQMETKQSNRVIGSLIMSYITGLGHNFMMIAWFLSSFFIRNYDFELQGGYEKLLDPKNPQAQQMLNTCFNVILVIPITYFFLFVRKIIEYLYDNTRNHDPFPWQPQGLYN